MLGYEQRRVRPEADGSGPRGGHAGASASGAPLVIVEARAVETIEDLLAKDGGLSSPRTRSTRTTTFTSVARLLSALFVADDAPAFALVLAGRWAARRRAGALGRGPLPGRRPPAGLRAQRRQARRRDRPRPRPASSAESLAPDADGNIWWTRRPRGLRQAHRRGLEGPARGRPAVHRDHRQRGGPPPPGAGPRPAAAGPGAAARQAVAALPLPDPVPALRRGLARAEVLPVGAAEYDQGYGLDRLRDLTLVELASPRAAERHAPLRVAGPAVPARRPGTRAPEPLEDGEQAPGPGLQQRCAPTCSCPRRPR